jgi:hypothetical protein
MTRFVVDSINLQHGKTSHDAIRRLSGTDRSGTRWWMTTEEVMSRIRSGDDQFVAKMGIVQVPIGIYSGPNGPFLRTWAGIAWNGDLLALPRCLS